MEKSSYSILTETSGIFLSPHSSLYHSALKFLPTKEKKLREPKKNQNRINIECIDYEL